jgi:hypothetical protein
LDVVSTVNLHVGETYLLFNHSGYQQEVTVASILSPNRIRVTPALTGLVTFPAWLGRTDWAVATPRQALAPAGSLYRTRALDLGPGTPEGHAIIIRHSGVGTLDVEWSDATNNGMVDAPWWRKRTVGGATETQYLIPSNGPTHLRITALGGPVTVEWITTQPRPAMAEGTYNPSPRPRLVSPAPDDQALGPQPVLHIAAYTPPPGLTVAGIVYEVAKVSDNSVIHTSAPQPVGSAYTLPDAVVQQGTAYRFTAKIKASGGSLGDPSKPIFGKTIPDFRVIVPPSITVPASGATVQSGAIVTLSAFQVLRGADTQTGVQMQVRRDGTGWSEAWDSGILAVGAVLKLEAPGARIGWAVEIRCRYWGAALGAGAWSPARTVAISNEIWLTTPGDGVFEIPEDGEYEVIPLGGGASGSYGGGSSGTGGGSGYRPAAIPRKTYTKGDLVAYRVGVGGPAIIGQILVGGSIPGDFCMGGQDSFFDDVVGLGGYGVPFGTTPTNSNGGIYSTGGNRGKGGSDGGGRYFTYGTDPGSDGYPGDGGYGYWSGVGLRPGLPGTGSPPSPFPSANQSGAGGVEPPVGSISLTGLAYWIGQTTGRLDGATGGKGYAAGGPGAPYFGGHQGGGDYGDGRSGAGAQGVIILRKVS